MNFLTHSAKAQSYSTLFETPSLADLWMFFLERAEYQPARGFSQSGGFLCLDLIFVFHVAYQTWI